MTDHTIVIIWVMKIFFYSYSVYTWHLFLIFSASVRTIQFLSFIVPIFASNVPLISNFLEEIFSLSLSNVFLYFFALIIEEDFLISPCYSLKLCIQGLYLSFLLCLSLLFFSQLFVRLPHTTILPFCIPFSWGWSWSLPPVQCHEPSSIVLQTTLSIRSNPLNLFVTFTV